jgi:hypothetical protein
MAVTRLPGRATVLSTLRRIRLICDAGIIAFTALDKDDFIASGPVRHFDGYCQKGGTHAPLLALMTETPAFSDVRAVGALAVHERTPLIGSEPGHLTRRPDWHAAPTD